MHYPESPKAMFLVSQSYAFGLSKLCFWSLKAMLLDSQSYALELSKLCSWTFKAMFLHSQSYVPNDTEHTYAEPTLFQPSSLP